MRRDRVVVAAQIAQGDAEVVVGLGIIRPQCYGLAVMLDRRFGLSRLAQGVAEVVAGLVEPRVEPQRPAG